MKKYFVAILKFFTKKRGAVRISTIKPDFAISLNPYNASTGTHPVRKGAYKRHIRVVDEELIRKHENGGGCTEQGR